MHATRRNVDQARDQGAAKRAPWSLAWSTCRTWAAGIFLLALPLVLPASTMPTQNHTYTNRSSTSTITFAVSGAGSLTWSYTRMEVTPGSPPASSGFYDSGAMLALVSGNGVSSGTTVFNYTGHGTPLSGSGTYGSTIAANQWLMWYLPVFDGASRLGYDQGWIQYGQDTVVLAGTNTRSTAIRITTYATGTTTPALTTTDVVAGAAYSITVPLPTGVAGIDVKVWVPSTYGDGTWIEAANPAAGTGVTTMVNVPSNTTTPATVPSTLPKPAINSSTGGGLTWQTSLATQSTTLASTLDKATYREGVQQLANAINEVDPSLSAASYASAASSPLTVSSADAIASPSHLPAAPTITAVSGSVATIGWDLNLINQHGVIRTNHFTADLSQNSTAVTVFRTACTGGLYLMFFFLILGRVKGAVAT